MAAAKRTTKTTKKHVIKKRLVNHVALVLDKSGSMGGIWRASQAAVNQTITDLISNAAKLGQNTFLSLYEFGTEVVARYQNKPIKAVLHENQTFFSGLGMTALRDAVGQAITDLCAVDTNDGDDHAFVIMAITDGAENQSVKFTQGQLQQLITRVQNTDQWTITFMVPPGSEHDVSVGLGVPAGNVTAWEATDEGAERAGAVRTMSVGTYFAARSQGQRSVKNFYVTTDASNITKKDLNQLDNIAPRCRVWTVDKETTIQPFVESKGLPYRRGCAFYQLTKKEKIQSYKKILIMEKGKKAIYEGDEARALIGLPVGQNATVTPGNHSNFDVFAQSTSNNRILVRGTRVIVDAQA